MRTYETVTVDVADFIATITLARPPVNAMNIQLCLDIAAAFDDLRDRTEDVRAIVLTGAGKCFCAGRDTKVAHEEPSRARASALAAAMSAVYHAEIPVISAVNGPAIGAGFRLALQSDLILASSNATFAMPEIDLSLNPSVASMLRGLNQFQAREIAFTGRRYSAAELAGMGLLRELNTPVELAAEAHNLAAVLAAKNTVALRAAKWSANEVELLFTDFEAVYRAVESRA